MAIGLINLSIISLLVFDSFASNYISADELLISKDSAKSQKRQS